MHLLSAQAGAIQQEGEAIDLAQSAGALIFASAADSELAMLAAAADRAGETKLRLANTLRLSHNLSVDLWLDQTVSHARLVVLRLIGGVAYFQYGVDELTALCANHRIPLVLLPGDANPDPILQSRSTIHPDDWQRLHSLLIAGGPDNADALLQAFKLLAAPSSPHPSGERSPAKPAGEGPLLATLTPAPFARFGLWHPALGMTDEVGLRAQLEANRPHVPILFYRAALEGAGTATITALIAELERQHLAPVPVLVSSLKELPCVRFVQNALSAFPPAAIFNLTGFALGLDALDAKSNPFATTDAPVIQLIQSGRSEGQWLADPQGLSSKDMAMFLVMPELDGRLGGLIVGHKADAVWHERCQVPLTAYTPDHSGISRAVALASNWSRLRVAARAERKVALVLANYPIRDGRLANGVGYDAPQSTVEMLKALATAGYDLSSPLPSGEGSAATRPGEGAFPATGNALIEQLQSGPTNANPTRGSSPATLTLARYRTLFAMLPPKIQPEVTTRWGDPATDPFVRENTFHLPALIFGNVAILLQPARGYQLDETTSYHDPALVPPHAYLAAYLWLRHEFGAHALIHNGKHGTLEWLPGKATALDDASYSDALWGQLPHLYPFIVNDPGEGTQAKRRTGAVIIDHLVPPLTRAEIYGPLKDLEALLDEYYAASGMDRRRLADLRRRILDFTRDARLDRDIGLPEDETAALIKIDNFLCDLKEAQIRDGLHIFGQSPQGDVERDLTVALARVPRGDNGGKDASLIRALADDLKLGFDPLTAKLGEPWTGPVPISPRPPADTNFRTVGDVVEHLESIASRLVDGEAPPADWTATHAVLATVNEIIRPRLAASGPAEMQALLDSLDGKFIAPGPSGAPSRGRLDVLPTGRNFYSVDNRAIPTPTAWELGKKSAESLVLRHFQDHGVYLKSVALSVWGTANMRTGGDDIAQALALIGARPTWDPSSLRVSGYEIIPLPRLDRPRVDVTLRISGFFRDAFPAQIALVDRAVRAIGALDEPTEDNPIAARMRTDALGLMAEGNSERDAALAAGHRIFGSKPGTYGAGLSALIDSGTWTTKADLANRALDWGQYAYGAQAAGVPERARFAARLSDLDAVIHNQDNREHDLLDSDNYYQFEGGLAAAAEMLSGTKPLGYHNDHSRPERPLIKTLEEEISFVMRSRVVNPKWLNGVKRHGYKGAFEIIATLDFMFAFAATTGAVKSHHFDLAFEAFVEDQATRDFIKQNNRFGYDELIAKFNEARQRGLWTPRSNSAYAYMEETP
ncbi:MAG: cobaltochelatase subunit CobN [Devosia sp.]|uniref:cobaltochelatase subunit CobN n=1 Tax=Devosia sp. TaxID=1871048 RepID=UPI002601F255|nr:cobaltochelatase subunit CobN [Devosia sp.]MDB5528812.1 cobaltochelatase subunit CobN [Devosia sp.]